MQMYTIAYTSKVMKLTTKECYRMQGERLVIYLEGCFHFRKVLVQCCTVAIRLPNGSDNPPRVGLPVMSGRAKT